MFFVTGVGQHVEQLGVAGRAADVFGRAGALAVHAARRRATRTEHADLVGPVVAEVVQVGKPGAQIG